MGALMALLSAPFAGTVIVEYDKTGQPSVMLSSDELQLRRNFQNIWLS